MSLVAYSQTPNFERGEVAAGTPAMMKRCRWVKPELVCQVKFTEWTGEGKLRQPVSLGLREDKAARDVIRERPSNAKS